jgi:hypothetical protein
MSSWEGEQWILAKEMEEIEGGESEDEKMMRVKLKV